LVTALAAFAASSTCVTVTFIGSIHAIATPDSAPYATGRRIKTTGLATTAAGNDDAIFN
jgi:hypothetical protein